MASSICGAHSDSKATPQHSLQFRAEIGPSAYTRGIPSPRLSDRVIPSVPDTRPSKPLAAVRLVWRTRDETHCCPNDVLAAGLFTHYRLTYPKESHGGGRCFARRQERQMRMRVVSILPNVTSRVLAITIFTTLQGVTVLAADHCITNPDFRATKVGHWYYHFDAVKNHKCWFLREQGVSSAEVVPDSNSLLSSLLAFASPSESRQRALLQSGSATSNSTDALRRDEVLPNQDSEVALRYSHRKQQVSKLQERSSSPSSEKKRQRSTIPDQASNDALFREFLLWKERQSTVDALDESGRDALFREFLHWNERQL